MITQGIIPGITASYMASQRGTMTVRFSPTVLACRYARFVNPVEYQQAFTAEGARLCICCLAPVTACSTRQTAVLDGAMDLFCGYIQLPIAAECGFDGYLLWYFAQDVWQ